jgi:hypothetical protein
MSRLDSPWAASLVTCCSCGVSRGDLAVSRPDWAPGFASSCTARSYAAAAAAYLPRALASPAVRSNSAATASSGVVAAAARCHARRSASAAHLITSGEAKELVAAARQEQAARVAGRQLTGWANGKVHLVSGAPGHALICVSHRQHGLACAVDQAGHLQAEGVLGITSEHGLDAGKLRFAAAEGRIIIWQLGLRRALRRFQHLIICHHRPLEWSRLPRTRPDGELANDLDSELRRD